MATTTKTKTVTSPSNIQLQKGALTAATKRTNW